MNRFLVRGANLPWDNPSHFEFITRDLAMSNTGNMLFKDSIIRSIMANDDDEFTLIRNSDIPRFMSEIDRVNEEYDYFVIPLANAFRDNFTSNLLNLASFVGRLRIPCVVIGVGLQDAYEPSFNNPKKFDDAAKLFCRAVLDKSVSIGVRGEITYNYLTKQLELPKNSVDIIGCPSMQLYSGFIPPNAKDLSSLDKIATNFDNDRGGRWYSLISYIWNEYRNSIHIPQLSAELRFLYWGEPIEGKSNTTSYSLSDKMYTEGRVISFVNTLTWIEYLQQCTFSIGTRFHGSVAAVLAGVPTILLTHDSRTRELAEYHNIPCVAATDMCVGNDEAKTFLRLIENTDFSLPYKVARKNTRAYIQFLDRNKLPCVYREDVEGLVPSDKKTAMIDYTRELLPITFVSSAEVEARLRYLHDYLRSIPAC